MRSTKSFTFSGADRNELDKALELLALRQDCVPLTTRTRCSSSPRRTKPAAYLPARRRAAGASSERIPRILRAVLRGCLAGRQQVALQERRWRGRRRGRAEPRPRGSAARGARLGLPAAVSPSASRSDCALLLKDRLEVAAVTLVSPRARCCGRSL